MSFLSWSSPRTRATVVVGALSLTSLLGCGYDTYELRLKQTKEYYAYLERVEANLGPKWADGQGILELRAPIQFVPIAPPQPITAEDGTVEMPAVDPRQPDIVTLQFPELLGAWVAPVDVALADGSSEKRNAYIYALSNYWNYAGENVADAQNFTKLVTELIATSLEETAKEEPPEMHPKPGSYLPSANYTVTRFNPKPIRKTTEERETTVNYVFEVYLRENGDIQCPIVVVLPEGIDQREKINERIPMMLDYVKTTKTKPPAGVSKDAPAAGGKAAASPSGF
jgi:hypothetical protein